MPNEPRLKTSTFKGPKTHHELTVEVVVVGSGAGGATAAAKMAMAGKEVLVLEEGRHFQGRDFTQRETHMLPQLYRAGGSQLTADGGISVVQGRCIGGSTTINMGDAEGIEEPVFAHWQKHYGWDYSFQDALPYQQWAREHLEVSLIPDGLVNKSNRAILQAAQKRGWKSGVLENFRKGCVGSGYCMIGCAFDAKRGVMLNILPLAVQHGAHILTGAMVTQVLLRNNQAVGVEGQWVNPTDYSVKGSFRVNAKTVIVAAGTIHSPALLIRSGLPHANLGKNLTLQPHIPLGSRFAEKMNSHRGVPQSVYVNEFDEWSEDFGLSGFKMEPIFHQPGAIGSSFAADVLYPMEVMSRYDHMAGSLISFPDQPGGHLQIKKDRIEINYKHNADVPVRVKKALRLFTELWFDAGAVSVFLPTLEGIREITSLKELSLLDKGLRLPRLFSPHPQGTCRMGPEPKKSVVDLNGQVHGVKHLYVMDGSVFPTTASHHTTIPIVSTVAHLSERLLSV